MDITTQYMGLQLKTPIILSASPFTHKADSVRKLQDAGVGAITMHSLFEEQIKFEAEELNYYLDRGKYRYSESLDDYPEEAHEYYRTGPENYLEQLAAVKAQVDVPVIASLNGVTTGGWIEYAEKLQEAGADALEINLYFLPTDPEMSGRDVEQRYIDVLRAVKGHVSIPVAMKLSPFFSATANMVTQLDKAGVDGLVLFNRFYQPALDIDELDVRPRLVLSTPEDSLLPQRWIALLFGRINASMSLTSGVHDSRGLVQALMAGADAVSICSVLLKQGPAAVGEMLNGLQEYMGQHEYTSVREMRGVLSAAKSPDPASFERANYMKTLAIRAEPPQIPH